MRVVRVKDVGPSTPEGPQWFRAWVEGEDGAYGEGASLTEAIGKLDQKVSLLPPAEQFQKFEGGIRLRHFPDIFGFGKSVEEQRGSVVLNSFDRFCLSLVY